MTLPVFVVDAAALAAESVELTGAEGRHAVVVKRIRLGEQILLTDGAGHWGAVPRRVAGRVPVGC